MQAMSLGSMLHSVLRPKVPESVLVPCLEGDRQLVENILMMAQELMPTLDITRAALVKENASYIVHVPCAVGVEVPLNILLDMQAFNPGRIQNIYVLYRNESMHVRVVIQDETTPITSTQLDIVRVCKRRRG